jgi:hypothetical protein
MIVCPDFFEAPRLPGFQSLLDVGDLIVRVLDADRQPDRRVQNSDVLTDARWHAGMSHARRQACKGLSASEARRQLD